MQAIFTSPTGGTAAFARSRPTAPSPRSPAAAMDLWAMEAPPRQPPSAATCMARSEEHTSELQSLRHLVCRLLLEKKKNDSEEKWAVAEASVKSVVDTQGTS